VFGEAELVGVLLTADGTLVGRLDWRLRHFCKYKMIIFKFNMKG
jgi:hypothetical protein